MGIHRIGDRNVSDTIPAHFDGHAIIPDVPVTLRPGQKLQVRIETVEPDDFPLAQIKQLAVDMGVADLADRHQQYARPPVEPTTDE
jgi:hypothetical protein